jgi:methionyl aminopeptidase
MAIMIKTPQEIEKMRRSGAAVREVLEHVKALVKPGVTTLDLEEAAESKIAALGATSAFKGYRGYPCVLCTSVNEQVVHGIPSRERVLRDGDIVSIDCGVVLDGYYGDSAVTVPVGAEVAPKTRRLLDVTKASLETAIKVVRPGATLGDIGAAVQEVVEADGFSVVREFVGHGIGTRMHEDPQVPNYGQRGAGTKLRAGMVNVGKPGVQVLSDGWTAVTEDGSLSAHFEHTVAVTAEGAVILTQ